MTRNTLDYPAAISSLTMEFPPAPLGRGQPNHDAHSALQALSIESLGGPIHNRAMADACLAGLWLRHSYIDESHEICQAIDTPAGSYWHAIVHRREGDFSNAKYWFRRVGQHSVFLELARDTHAIIDTTAANNASLQTGGLHRLTDGSSWDPFAFVDLCEAADSGHNHLLQQIAHREWELLFENCYRHALGIA